MLEPTTVSRQEILVNAKNTANDASETWNPAAGDKETKSRKPATGKPTDATAGTTQPGIVTQTGIATQATTSSTTSIPTDTTTTTLLPTFPAVTTTMIPANPTGTTTTAFPTSTTTPATPTTTPTNVWPTTSTMAPTTSTTATPTTATSTPTTATSTTTTATPTTPTPTTRATTAATTTTTPTTTASTVPAAPAGSVSVKSHGALGDGTANDTAAIQRALNTGASLIWIPDGVYMIDTLVGIRPKSNQTIQLSAGATLRAIPNSAASYSLVRFGSVSNAEICGGTIQGDRAGHLGTTGEWGMGIAITAGTANIRVRNTTIRDFWGDGIYLGGGTTTGFPKNILVEGVVSDNNRRQGFSITSGEYITVRNSVFSNTAGTNPQCGIDIEPNEGNHVSHVVIESSRFLNNYNYGLIISPRVSDYIDDVLIKSNTFSGNGARGIYAVNLPQATNIRLEIRSGQSAIGAYEFSACQGITQVTIPSSVTSIGNNAFNNCSRLTAAYFYGNAPTMGTGVFAGAASGFTVRYLASRSGFTAPTWKGYAASTFEP